MPVRSGLDRDTGQVLGGGIRVDRAIAVDEDPIGQTHQEDAGHGRRSRRGLDDLERRDNGVRGGVRR